MKRNRLLHIKLFLTSLFVAACASQDNTASIKPRMIVYYVSDLHSQIVQTHEQVGGYARIKAYLDQERNQAGPHTDVLFVIGGDLFGKGRLPCKKTKEKACAPLVKELRPDLIAFGNGELKFEYAQLEQLANLTGGTWISTDVLRTEAKKKAFWRNHHLVVGAKSGIKLNFLSTTLLPGPGEAMSGSNLDFKMSANPFEEQVKNFANLEALNFLIVHDSMDRVKVLSKLLCSQGLPSMFVLKAHEHLVQQSSVGCLDFVEAGSYGANVAKIIVEGAKPRVRSVQMVPMNVEQSENPQMLAKIEAVYKTHGVSAQKIVAEVQQDRDRQFVGEFLARTYQRTSRADVAIVNSGAIKHGFGKGKLDWEMVLNAIPYNNQLHGLDWNIADLEKALCSASKRSKDTYLDNGSDLILYGAKIVDPQTNKCRVVFDTNKKNPKVVVDSFLVKRSERWLGRDLRGKTFSYGLDTERALELGIQIYGKKEL